MANTVYNLLPFRFTYESPKGLSWLVFYLVISFLTTQQKIYNNVVTLQEIFLHFQRLTNKN